MRNMFLLLLVPLFILGTVLITIMHRGTYPLLSFTDEKSMCIHGGLTACETTGDLPPNWNSSTEGNKSCHALTRDLVRRGNGTRCEDYGW